MRQLQKLRTFPLKYCGWALNGKIVAYMKQGEWLLGDEHPFTTGARYCAIQQSLELHHNPSNGKWGVFGLVVYNGLDTDVRQMILENLLEKSLIDPSTKKPRIVHIIMHEHDPLLEIALSHGFVPVWQKAEAPGAPGLEQQCYQRA